MDISKWPINKIMQLPDCCFGKRWPIMISGSVGAAITEFNVSGQTLPDKWVLWELDVIIWPSADVYTGRLFHTSIAMGEHKPANEAEFDKLDGILPGASYMSNGRKTLLGPFCARNIKQNFIGNGRKICTRVRNVAGITTTYSVNLIISTIPKEVPDWLSSGRAAMLS